MKKSARRGLFLSLLLVSLVWTCAEAADSNKEDLKGLPGLTSYELYQLGGSDLMVTVQGKGLPSPEVSHNGNQTVVTLRETRLEKKVENRSSTVPMVTAARAEQSGRDAIITLTTELPMTLSSIRGTAPSDAYTLRMATVEQRQKEVEEPVVTKQPQTLKVPTGPFAVTTPINLDLRDTELRDVFRMLGVHLKKNIIIDPSLPPALVTMTLKNVPLNEAFAYLMKTYNVGYQMVGKDTIVIGTEDGIMTGEEETRAYRIAYAEPAALPALLVNMTRIPADRLVVDPRLRTIYATARPAKLEEIAIALQELDHPGRQVLLQARILEYSDSDSLQVEQQINAVYNHWWMSYTGAGGMTGGFIDDNRQGRNYTEPSDGIFSNITDMTTPMEGVWREFDFSFRAMEGRNKGKTLANPSVITIDGVEASVSLTEDYPYISGRDDGGNPSWSTETVGPQLKMTPKVGRDGIITLTLNIEAGEVIDFVTGSTGETMPRTSTRSFTTNVRVRNGEPFVIGGLFRENNTRELVRIPVLGSIPLLGEIFSYRQNRNDKTQVVVIVVPYILNTPDVGIEHKRVMYRQ